MPPFRRRLASYRHAFADDTLFRHAAIHATPALSCHCRIAAMLIDAGVRFRDYAMPIVAITLLPRFIYAIIIITADIIDCFTPLFAIIDFHHLRLRFFISSSVIYHQRIFIISFSLFIHCLLVIDFDNITPLIIIWLPIIEYQWVVNNNNWIMSISMDIINTGS